MDRVRAIKSADVVVAETVAAIAEYKAKYRLYESLLGFFVKRNNENPKRLDWRAAKKLSDHLSDTYGVPVDCAMAESGVWHDTCGRTMSLVCRKVPSVPDAKFQLYESPDFRVDTDRSFIGWSNLQWYAEQMEAKLDTIRFNVDRFNSTLRHLQSISNVAASASNGKFDVALGPLAKHFCWYELKG